MPFYKLQGRKTLADMGPFFRKVGSTLFRFMPRELDDLSEYLLEAVQKYVPVRTGALKMSLVAEANINMIAVVARAEMLLSSEYQKDYAEFVEAGVFGKDMSRLIRTPKKGGPSLVMSPESTGGAMPFEVDDDMLVAITEYARETVGGYAQFMRAGMYDAMPELLFRFSVIIEKKVKREYYRLSGGLAG